MISLVDELFQQDSITRNEYKQRNTMLPESLDEEINLASPDSEEGEEDEFNQSTTNDVIESDKKELMGHLTELKEEVPEDIIDGVLQLEKRIDAFLINAYLEGKPMVDEIMTKLERSILAKSKQQRLKILIDDINSSRYCVHSIFTSLDVV